MVDSWMTVLPPGIESLPIFIYICLNHIHSKLPVVSKVKQVSLKKSNLLKPGFNGAEEGNRKMGQEAH